MLRTVVSDLVEPITDKQVADQARPEAYVGLEHIPERAYSTASDRLFQQHPTIWSTGIRPVGGGGLRQDLHR